MQKDVRSSFMPATIIRKTSQLSEGRERTRLRTAGDSQVSCTSYGFVSIYCAKLRLLGGGGSVVIHICQRSKHSLRVWVPCLRSHGAERGLKLSPGGLWSTAQGAANFCPMISSVPCPPQGHGVPLDASRNRVRCPILVGHPGYAFIFLNV